MITVRIAHAEPGPGRQAGTGPRIDPHRALRAWLAQDPDGTPLPALLDRAGDDIWTTQGIPEELAVRLMSAAGGSVTGVEIHPDGADITPIPDAGGWTRHEITARVPGNSDAVVLGIFLAAAGQIELRNPELIRRD